MLKWHQIECAIGKKSSTRGRVRTISRHPGTSYCDVMMKTENTDKRNLQYLKQSASETHKAHSPSRKTLKALHYTGAEDVN